MKRTRIQHVKELIFKTLPIAKYLGNFIENCLYICSYGYNKRLILIYKLNGKIHILQANNWSTNTSSHTGFIEKERKTKERINLKIKRINQLCIRSKKKLLKYQQYCPYMY